MRDFERSLQSFFETDKTITELITPKFSEQLLPKNDFHSEQDKTSNSLSYVVSGYLRIYRNTSKGEVTQYIVSPGEFVTDLNALIFRHPNRWQIQALSPCKLYSLNQADYTLLSKEIPQWIAIERLLLAKCFIFLEERIFSFISSSSEERYHYLFENKKELFNEVPLHYLASMIGMTPETFSRVRKKLIS